MLGTPIWPNMRVPGPRLKNPSAIPVCYICACIGFPSALRGTAYSSVWREEGAFCMECLVVFSLPPLPPPSPSTFHCLSE